MGADKGSQTKHTMAASGIATMVANTRIAAGSMRIAAKATDAAMVTAYGAHAGRCGRAAVGRGAGIVPALWRVAARARLQP